MVRVRALLIAMAFGAAVATGPVACAASGSDPDHPLFVQCKEAH